MRKIKQMEKKTEKKSKCCLEVWVRRNSNQILDGKENDKVFEQNVIISNCKTDILETKV